MPLVEEKHYFPAVGRCIYCGVTEETARLGDEHIIPAGLGGKLILQKASCYDCSHITGAVIERQCLRRMLGPLRLRRGLANRRKKKERPKTLPSYIQVAGKWQELQAPLNRRVDTTVLYFFSEPGILVGKTPQQARELTIAGMWFSVWEDDAAKEWARKQFPQASRYGAKAWFHPDLFQKMLAKIAHAYAVAELGIDNFTPLLPKAIIGREPWQPGYYVGGYPSEMPRSEYMSEIGFADFPSPDFPSPDGTPFKVVKIRLFGDMGAPVYFIAVGLPLYANIDLIQNR